MRVNAKKVDGDKKGLAGAKFTVYDNESLSNESILGVLESSADGTTNELSLGFNMNITEVTLYCQETTPPDGYIGTDEIFKVTFKKADYDKLKSQDANTKGELKTFSTEIVNVSVTLPLLLVLLRLHQLHQAVDCMSKRHQRHLRILWI